MTAPLPPVGLRLMLRIRTPPHRSPQFTTAASHYRFASVRPPVVSFAFHNTVSPNKPGVDACRLLAIVLFLCVSETQSLDHSRPRARPSEAGEHRFNRHWRPRRLVGRARPPLRRRRVHLAVAKSAPLIVADRRRRQHPTDPRCTH